MPEYIRLFYDDVMHTGTSHTHLQPIHTHSWIWFIVWRKSWQKQRRIMFFILVCNVHASIAYLCWIRVPRLYHYSSFHHRDAFSFMLTLAQLCRALHAICMYCTKYIIYFVAFANILLLPTITTQLSRFRWQTFNAIIYYKLIQKGRMGRYDGIQ